MTTSPATAVATAMHLIETRDAAYDAGDRSAYRAAFTAISKLDGHVVEAAERALRDERKATVSAA